METDFPQAIFFQQALEFLTDKIRLQKHSHIVYAFEVQVVLIVAAATELHLCKLLITQITEIVVGIGAQGQRTTTVLETAENSV